MSGSGMIAAIPEGLAIDVERPNPIWEGIGFSEEELQAALAVQARLTALGIICHAAAKCTEVQSLADCGRIDRDGADLFVRRYSESIADIVALIAPAAPKQKGN